MPIKTFTDEQPSLNLMPMIDVMLNLVLFLVLGAQFAQIERDIAVKVPGVGDVTASPKTEAPQRKIVNVRKNGAITLNEKPVSLAQLQTELQAAHREYRDLGVIIRGDGAGTWQNVASVLNAVRLAGVTDILTSVRLDGQSQ